MSERLQNKMYDYEVTPPATAWEKIAEALNESELEHSFPAKLYGIEIAPPATTWDTIKNSLDSKEVEQQQQKQVFPFYRYAIAAAVIGLIVWGGIQLFNDKSITKNVAQREEKPGVDTITDNTGEDNGSATDKKNDAALELSKQTLAKLDIPVAKKIKAATKNYFLQRAVSATQNNDPVYSAYQENTANRYIAIMTPDCNVVRISKKLDHLVCCVAGDDAGTPCSDQMQKWREQIAASSIASSPGNFMDIFNLVNSLQVEND